MGTTNKSNRRRFLGNTAAIGALGVVGASQLIRSCSSDPAVTTGTVTEPTILDTAIDGQPLRAGVVGCGGRGTGAALDFLNAGPNLSVVAAADVFQDRVDLVDDRLPQFGLSPHGEAADTPHLIHEGFIRDPLLLNERLLLSGRLV